MTNVLEWLERSAERTPDKVAVAGIDDALTFAELRDAARSCGSWLAARGAGVGDGVALYLEKSPEAFAGMLGAVYAGCFYSVLDVRQPPSRTCASCERIEPVVVLSDAAHIEQAREVLAGTPWEIVALEDVLAATPDEDLLAAARAAHVDTDPLYVNFTSGSTGTPKGVVISHRSVIDFIPTFTSTFGMTADEVFANQAPFDFDVSVKDLYSGLLLGATVQLVPREYFSKPMELVDLLCDREVTTLVWAVSAMCFVSVMNAFDYRVPKTVRNVLFSGEVMPPKQLAVWQRNLPDATYVNLYGPTEITCNCTYHVVERAYAADEVIPIGRAFPNERVLLLAEDGTEVHEEGVEGELCVGGSALGLGYLGDLERTAESFVQNPGNRRWLEPLYRTGDLARYDADGNLVYTSRKDHQIKLMGQRIELGDIEATAQAADGVTRACCLYDQARKRLVLCYTGSTGKDDVVAWLRERLPQYMVPGRTVQVDEMPLTKNGKIDRTALMERAGRRRRRRERSA